MTLEAVRKIFETSSFFNHLGLQIVRFEPGDVMIELLVQPHLMNANDTVHGGVHASMLDSIIGMTIRSVVEHPLTTINLNIHYLAPSTGGKLVARGKVLQQGYRIITGEGEVFDGEGKLLAKGIGSFKVMHSKR